MADDEKNKKASDTTPVSDSTATDEAAPETAEASDTSAQTSEAETPVAEDVPESTAPAAAEKVSDTSAQTPEAETTGADEVSDAGAPAAADETPAPADAATPEVSDSSATADADATAADEASETPAAAAADHDVSDPGVTLAEEKKPRSNRHVPRSQRRTRTKPAREKPATRKAITRTPKPESELGRRQERRGVVISDKGDKTIVVKVDVIKSHPRYKKVVRRAVKFHAHDEQNTAGIGDTVRIIETRPLSRTKRWRLAEIVEKAR